MLRAILESFLHPETAADMLENKEMIETLMDEQRKALRVAIEKKDLLSYLELAHTFEHNGDPKEQAKKLEALFKDAPKALQYLLDYGKKYPKNTQFVHDACLFPMPSESAMWKKLTLQNGAKLLLDPELKQILFQTKEVEAQLVRDKEHSDELLKQLFVKYRTEKVEEIVKYIINRISEINKFCHQYETQSQARKGTDEEKYKKLLIERNELFIDSACLHLKEPLKQWSFHNLRDYYARYLSLTHDGIKGFFFKHGLSESNYRTFLTLNRENAGENIPEILLDGSSIGYPGFYLKKLNVKDLNSAALAACLGKLTNCCQSLSGEAGESCAIHGLTSPNGAFYVLFKGDVKNPKDIDQLYAQSWVWKGKTNGIVFDSIEVPMEQNKSKTDKLMIAQMYRNLGFKLVHEQGVPSVNCGNNSGITVGYDYTIDTPEEPIEYDSYRDSETQSFLAHKDFTYNLESRTQPDERAFQQELESKKPIDILTKLNYTIEIASKLKRFDVLDFLIMLAKKHRPESDIKYIVSKIDPKEFLDLDEKDLIIVIEFSLKHKDLIQIDGDTSYKLINKAIDLQNTALVKKILEFKPDLNKLDEYENTPLGRAVINPHNVSLEIIELLIDGSSETNRNNAFVAAAMGKSKSVISVLELLINKGKVSINAKFTASWHGTNGGTALHYAVLNNQYEIVKFLLNYKDEQIDLEALDNDKNTPIFNAMYLTYIDHYQNNIEIFKCLLQKGANINVINASGETLLMLMLRKCYPKDDWKAAFYDKVRNEKAKMLLEYKADLSHKNSFGSTAITDCVRADEESLLRIMLESGMNFDVNAKDMNDETALFIAAACIDRLSTVRLLLDHGADPSKLKCRHEGMYTSKIWQCINEAQNEEWHFPLNPEENTSLHPGTLVEFLMSCDQRAPEVTECLKVLCEQENLRRKDKNLKELSMSKSLYVKAVDHLYKLRKLNSLLNDKVKNTLSEVNILPKELISTVAEYDASLEHLKPFSFFSVKEPTLVTPEQIAHELDKERGVECKLVASRIK